MADQTANCTATQALPVPNKKAMVVVSDATLATSDTIDVSAAALGGFASVDIALCFADDGTGGVQTVTIAGTVLTMGTLTTGIHHILVVGNAA